MNKYASRAAIIIQKEWRKNRNKDITLIGTVKKIISEALNDKLWPPKPVYGGVDVGPLYHFLLKQGNIENTVWANVLDEDYEGIINKWIEKLINKGVFIPE